MWLILFVPVLAYAISFEQISETVCNCNQCTVEEITFDSDPVTFYTLGDWIAASRDFYSDHAVVMHANPDFNCSGGSFALLLQGSTQQEYKPWLPLSNGQCIVSFGHVQGDVTFVAVLRQAKHVTFGRPPTGKPDSLATYVQDEETKWTTITLQTTKPNCILPLQFEFCGATFNTEDGEEYLGLCRNKNFTSPTGCFGDPLFVLDIPALSLARVALRKMTKHAIVAGHYVVEILRILAGICIIVGICLLVWTQFNGSKNPVTMMSYNKNRRRD